MPVGKRVDIHNPNTIELVGILHVSKLRYTFQLEVSHFDSSGCHRSHEGNRMSSLIAGWLLFEKSVSPKTEAKIVQILCRSLETASCEVFYVKNFTRICDSKWMPPKSK